MAAEWTKKVPPNQLPDYTRHVTGHNDRSQAIFVEQQTFGTDPIPAGDTPGYRLGFKVVYRTDEHPSETCLEPFKDPMKTVTENITCPGTVLRVVDFAPSGDEAGFMHRTESVDYGIVIHGNITCLLDSGEKKTLKPGDIMIQRGTIHGWINESKSEWTRMYFILIAAKPCVIDGKPLKEAGYHADNLATGGEH